jgi:hypothetical protein
MNTRDLSRRGLLRHGSARLTGLVLVHPSWLAQAFASRPGEEVIPSLDQPLANPSAGVVDHLHPWEDLASWLTPNDHFFRVAHYNKPVIDDKAWTLEITGLVQQPMRLTLDTLKARPRHEVVFTLECSGLPKAGCSCSMRSASSMTRCKPSCCACCRSIACVALGRIGTSPSTSGSSPRRTENSVRWCTNDAFVRTSSIVSTSWPSISPRCGSARWTSNRSWSTLCRSITISILTAR